MSSTICKGASLRSIAHRGFAAQAAASKQHSYSLPVHQSQVTQHSKGAIVASLENNSPISHIAVYVKSGARYEKSENAGVSHMTRLAAGLATESFSSFGLTRKIQQMGGTLVCENGREHMAYTMSFMRGHLQEGFQLVTDVCLHPSFKVWEVDTLKTRLMTELSSRDSSVQVVDLLHKAAYRNGGLGNSIFMPNYNVGKIDTTVLRDFVASTHSAPQIAVVGLGVNHGELVALSKFLQMPDHPVSPTPSSYHGGEVRIETAAPLAYVAVAGPGAKIGTDEAVNLAVAQCLLGGKPGIKYGANSSGKLTSFVASANGTGHAVALNAAYSDSGLFGFLLVEQADKVAEVLKAITKGIRTLKVTDSELEGAKIRAKAAVLMSAESTENCIEEMGLQSLFQRQLIEPSDFIAAIDKVTPSSVQAALASTSKGKPSMAAIGAISNVPYLDQL